MELKVEVFPFVEKCKNEEAFRFLKKAMADMFFRGISNCDDVETLLRWDDSYLLSCTNEANQVCGVFEVFVVRWLDDCYVNIAYTHPDYRRQGVFKTLFEFTANDLVAITGIDYETISFGIFNCNQPMRNVMKKSGCLPVERRDDVEATIYSFPRKASALERVELMASFLDNSVELETLST